MPLRKNYLDKPLKPVHVAGRKFKIRMPHAFADNKGLMGQCDMAQDEIKIQPFDSAGIKRSHGVVWVTVIEEVLHAIDNLSGYEVFPDDHKAIAGFSELLYQVLNNCDWWEK